MSPEAASAQAPGLFRFSTADLPERDRITLSREVVIRSIMKLDMEPKDDEPFWCEAKACALPSLSFGDFVGSAVRVIRTPELIAADPADDLVLHIQLRGAIRVSQRGREAMVTDRDGMVWLNDEPGSIDVSSAARCLRLRMPLAPLATMLSGFDPKHVTVLRGGDEALRLLRRYLPLLLGGEALATPELRHITVAHVYDLVALAIGATRDVAATAETRGLGAARLAAIKADVRANLADEALSVGAIAARHRVTPRSVQRLFEAEGVTFSEFLRDERLARAYCWLTDPRRAYLTVTTIAYAVGFSDLSYFHRSFRRRYGATPAEVRNEAPPLAPDN